ncbi:MAG: hypothetical protein IT318_20120 [Anaerolineales bacterium]|nr:hypothetical protein [Anaerolineales bacterium]
MTTPDRILGEAVAVIRQMNEREREAERLRNQTKLRAARRRLCVFCLAPIHQQGWVICGGEACQRDWHRLPTPVQDAIFDAADGLLGPEKGSRPIGFGAGAGAPPRWAWGLLIGGVLAAVAAYLWTGR